MRKDAIEKKKRRMMNATKTEKKKKQAYLGIGFLFPS